MRYFLMAAIAVCFLSSPAFAEVVATPANPNSVLNVGAVFGEVAAPYVNSLIGMALASVFGWVGFILKNKLGVDIDKTTMDKLQTALNNRANQLVAQGAVALQGVRLDVHNTLLAAAANDLIDKNKDTAAHLGLTPDVVAKMIVDKLPQTPVIATAQAAALADNSLPATGDKFSPSTSGRLRP